MKILNVLKVIDQWGWSYDFIGREQQRYSKHKIIINKYDNVNLEGIDVLYIHSPNIHGTLANLPVIAHEKGIKVIGAYGGDPKFWSPSISYKYSYADLIVTISPETYKYASDLYQNIPVVFLPESVDTNYFKPSNFKLTFNVGWAGSKFPLKRMHLLDKLHYKIIKQSKWGQEFFTQNRDQNEMLRFYQCLNAFILTSTTECMPRVVLEAMACGLPVVSTFVGNLPMLVSHEWLVPVHPDELVVQQMNCKLGLLKNNIELRKSVSQRNREHIKKFFSWEKNQPFWDSIFTNLYEENFDTIIEENQQYLSSYKQYFDQASFKKNFELKKRKKIAYIIPGTGISGGIAVILEHANRLQEMGYDVVLFSQDKKTNISWFPNKVQIVALEDKYLKDDIDVLIATGWTTVEVSKSIQAKRKIYFVQSDERRFTDDKSTKQIIEDTYKINYEFITEAKWIKEWLSNEFDKQAFYVPNGLNTEFFNKTIQKKSNKVRVLLEGPLTIPFKGVSDAYQAVKNLDCEIWIVSSDGDVPKSWRCNKFFKAVPIEKMKDIYSSCDILLKMSRVEGFFGPPMEAMACGCAVVVAKCTGYDEYIEHNKNALVVEMSDVQGATAAVKSLIYDKILREKLIKEGYETVKNWSWDASLQLLKTIIDKKQVDFKNEDKIEACDIIIVVHNALHFVKLCIESIKSFTNYSYRLIIVDNNSNEETKAYLKTVDAQIITNHKNYGFGYANNQGIRISTSKYVCFLNSDTIVTNNWLSRLIKHLEQENAGIVGPVTNCASSEIQQISFQYLIKDNNPIIQDFSEDIFKKNSNKMVQTNRLIGFCMLTTRNVLKKIGLFDDRYEFNFEDDDLCLRAIENGYKLFCSSGVFIYHFGGQSFKDKYKVVTCNPILEKSRQIYIDKWYKTNRVNRIYEKHDKFSISYILASDSPSGGVKVVFEHANRLQDRGYDVKIYCLRKETNVAWFDLYALIIYITEQTDIPQCDIAIGTYFSTLPFLQKTKANVKIHFSQGYEVLIYDKEREQSIVNTIQNNYRLVKEKIVVSKWLKQIIDSEYDIDCNYVPNGLDQYVYSFSKHNRNNILRILIVGNYNLEIKGVKIALKAVQRFLLNHKCAIVRLASEKTTFDLGYEFHDMSKMTQEQIANVYASCDVTVCASHKVEGFSLHGLESMASGTPVISTDNGGITDYAINNQNALIVPVGNSQSICDALVLLFSNSVLYSRLVEQGLITSKGYLWCKQIDMLENTLDMLYQKNKAQQKEQLSVCMIVKNEENNLAHCLDSIKDLANEIIIVDTGSADDTVKIAKKFGAKIFHYEWNNDFSAARNFSLEKATQSWVFVIDADEIISEKDVLRIRQLLKTKCAYSFETRNYVSDFNIEGTIACTGEYQIEEKDFVGWCRSEKVRLFPRNSDIKFEGQVHELVEDSLEKKSIKIEKAEVPIHHYGYLNRNKEKDRIYLNLGKQKAESEDLKSIYELANQYMSLNNYDEALILWRRMLEAQPENFDFLSRLATTYNLLSDYKQAEKYFLKSLEIQQTEYACKHLSICYAKQENYQRAYEVLKEIINCINDLKTLLDFSFCCNKLRKFDESILVLERCLKINQKQTVSSGLLEIAYNEKGVELAKNNRLQQALVMFKSSLSINNSFIIAKNNVNEISRAINSRKL